MNRISLGLKTLQMENSSTSDALLFPQFPMPFDFTSLSTDQVGNKYYHNTPYHKAKGLTVYSDDESSSLFENTETQELAQVEIYSNQSYMEFEDFDLVLFTSKDGALLLQQFKKVEPSNNEIVVFLELDGKVNFGKIMRVKVGTGILGKDNLPYSDIISVAHGKEVNISAKRIKKLLRKGVRSKQSLFKWVLSGLANKLSEGVQYIAGGIGDTFFTDIPKFINDYLHIEENGWNPKADNFSPLLIPDALERTLEELKTKRNAEKKIIDEVIKPFFKRLKVLEQRTIDSLEKIKSLLPRKIYRVIKRGLKHLFDKTSNIESYFYDSEFSFIDIVISNLRAANALLCGLWNSVIDVINGVFQIIGLVFLGIKEVADFSDNAGYYASLSIEVIENIIEDMFQIDFLEVFKTFLFLPIKLISSVVKFAGKAVELSVEQVYYFVGFLIGFIVETVLSILFAGGSLTINRVLLKTFKEPVDLLLKGFRKGIDASASLINKIIAAVKAIFKALKNPKQFVDDFIKFVKELLGINKNAIEEFDSLLEKVKSGDTKLDEFADGSKRKKTDYTRHTNFSEMLSDQKWLNLKKWSNGKEVDFIPLLTLVDDLDQPIKKGIDAVFENKLFSGKSPPPKYIINEVKYNTKTSPRTPNAWKNKLPKTKVGKQMGDKWIENFLKENFSKKQARDIFKNSEKMLTGVSKNGSKIEIFKLTDKATKIRTTKL